MHIEFLVEDQSGKTMLEQLVPKLIGSGHTYSIHSYKGIGRIPKGLKPSADPEKRILLDQLPRLLSGYSKAFAGYGRGYPAAVVVVCDLDDRKLATFLKELTAVSEKAAPALATEFCVAIEEGEAWFLGDPAAVLAAYPKAKKAVLAGYKQDSICGTWEVLAEAVYPGGREALVAKGYQVVGAEKSQWAERIPLHMTPTANKSPSFKKLRAVLNKLAP